MGVTVKVKACADCFSFQSGRQGENQLDSARSREVSSACEDPGAREVCRFRRTGWRGFL